MGQELNVMEARKLFVDRETEKALEIINPLAEQGDAEAQYLLGVAYELGHSPIEDNAAHALSWYLKSAKSGHRCAQRRIVESMFFSGKQFNEKPDKWFLGYYLGSDKPSTSIISNNFEYELYLAYYPKPYDEFQLFYRRIFIVTLVWGMIASMNDYFRLDYHYFKWVTSFKYNEILIAERLSQASQSGELWRWVAELRENWPTGCDR